MKKKNEYRTHHFYPACILFAKGFKLLGIDKSDPYQWRFVFKCTSELEKYVRDFGRVPENDPLVLVDVRYFMAAIEEMKKRCCQ